MKKRLIALMIASTITATALTGCGAEKTDEEINNENEIREMFSNSRVYATHIPRSNKIIEAQKVGKTIIEYAPKSQVCEAYINLAREVVNNGKF